jgi:hypothetical protein
MERNVRNLFGEYLNEVGRRSSHDHGPTPLDLQRWEDDGGALPPQSSRRAEGHHHAPAPELAAAE